MRTPGANVRGSGNFQLSIFNYQFSSTVLLTRPVERLEPWKSRLQQLGLTVLHQPAIVIAPLENGHEIDAAIEKYVHGQFDWLVFSSRHGVEDFCDRIEKRLAAPFLQNNTETASTATKFAAVGPGTAESLCERTGRDADLVPDVYVAEKLADALEVFARKREKFLLIRASRGRKVLRQKLEEWGGQVTEVAAYQSVDVTAPHPEIRAALAAHGIDWTVISSSASAVSLIRMFGGLLRRTKILSVGKIVTQTLTEQGFLPAAELSEASLSALENFFGR